MSIAAPCPLLSAAGDQDRLDQALAVTCQTAMGRAPYVLPNEAEPSRLERATAVVRLGEVRDIGKGYWTVPSSDGQSGYTLKDDDKHHAVCECEAATKGKSRWCYHAVAVELYRQTAIYLGVRVGNGEDAPGVSVQKASEIQQNAASIFEVPTKVESVARPTEVSLNTASGPFPPPPRRSIHAILADLSTPLPDACVATLERSGARVRYLHVSTVRRLLDAYAPGWEGTILRVEYAQGVCRVDYRLGIPCAEGMAHRESTGECDDWETVEANALKRAEKRGASGGIGEIVMYGSPSANAEANALKRAAKLFGVGAWLDDMDATAAALQKHLAGEKAHLWQALGEVADHTGIPRPAVEEWLKRVSGAGTRGAVPVGLLVEAVAALGERPWVETF